jgi:hypothetical protein
MQPASEWMRRSSSSAKIFTVCPLKAAREEEEERVGDDGGGLVGFPPAATRGQVEDLLFSAAS